MHIQRTLENMMVGTDPGLGVIFNMPKMLTSQRGSLGDEIAQGLPPYAPVRPYRVDDYVRTGRVPENWPKGVGAFFVPVQEDHGMWLDFNQCSFHPKDVAIMIGIQGVNALTGMPFEQGLHQYKHKCPKHGIPFGENRFCSQCGFAWPAQNYLTTTATPQGLLWLDGFRLDGKDVRQYYFTSDILKGVTAQLIGEKRNFHIEILFYVGIPHKAPQVMTRNGYYDSDATLESFGGATKGCANFGGNSTKSFGSFRSNTRSLEIAAGAKIRQQVHQDMQNMTYWSGQPETRIQICYASPEQMNQIMEHNSTASGEGFLNKVNTGTGNHTF